MSAGRKKELQIPALRYPGFPVELGGVGELHAAFLKESRTRGHCRCQVTGNPVRFGRDDKGYGGVSVQGGYRLREHQAAFPSSRASATFAWGFLF